MRNFDPLIQDLVIANRILAKEEVVDAYGHVSVRHPENPNRFLIARSLAPELVGPEDIVELGPTAALPNPHGFTGLPAEQRPFYRTRRHR
jgi:ribulose-5-phosphate 4-epimerase/fuculose-1-phosphate aldolase